MKLLLLAVTLSACVPGTDQIAREHFGKGAACQLTDNLTGPAQCIYNGRVYLCLRTRLDGSDEVQCAAVALPPPLENP